MEPRRPAEPAASTGTLNTRRLGRAQSTSVGLQGPPMPVQGHEATTAPSYRPSPEKCPPRRRQPLARSPPAWARLRSAVWEHRAVPRSPHGETGPATFAALLGAAAAAGTPRHAGVGALRGCARTSEALLPPSSSASPLTLLLEESQKRGEVPAHENHHGGQEEGLLPAGRGSAAAYRAGGRMPRPQLFLPTLVRAAGPAAGRPAGGCSPGGAAARGEAGAGGGMRGGRRGQPGCSQRAPGAGRRRAGPLLWPPAPPGPPPPPARSVRGRTLPGMGLSAENSPQILVLGGKFPRIIHINQDWSPPDTAALQTGVLAFTALWSTGRSWEAFPPQASTFGTCCRRAGRAGAPTSPPCPPARQCHGQPVALGDNRASDQSNQ